MQKVERSIEEKIEKKERVENGIRKREWGCDGGLS